MANLVVGRKYKIVNTQAQNALHVVPGPSNGVSVSTTPWKSTSNQFWKVMHHSPGFYQFALDNQPTPNTTYVLDASQTALGETCVYTSKASPNQLWSIEPIKPNAFLCFIKSKADGRVIQYDGENKKARVVAKDTGNSAQYWTFQE